MPRCANCRGKIGLLAKKFAGYSGEVLCKLCALRQQRRKFAERLDYKIKEVNAYPNRVEPLRDCERDVCFAQQMLQSSEPLSSKRSREIERLDSRHKSVPATELLGRRGEILASCKKTIEQLRR